MTKEFLVALGLIVAIPLNTTVAFAQGPAQTVVNYKVDIANVAVGFRSSKVVGSAVTNDVGDKIGSIDDMIVTRGDRVVYAITSIGGFLGVGDKLVAIPFASLQLSNDKVMLPGATKETLKGLPKFTYAT